MVTSLLGHGSISPSPFYRELEHWWTVAACRGTALPEVGIPPHMIYAIGRWSSVVFQIYIRLHPAVVLAAFLYGSPRSHSYFTFSFSPEHKDGLHLLSLVFWVSTFPHLFSPTGVLS